MTQEARAPWLAAQLGSLLLQRGHAWLLHGPSGLGQYTLALDLARAWLCERPTGQGACGTCEACHAVDVRTHSDLFVLMPETAMLALGWPLSEKAQAELDDKKRKPSKEIRVEAMREAVEFSQRTSALGRGKVALVYPAERMNQVTANALLKTLEEPAGDVRFVLATEAAHQLLPTIRSRCLGHGMTWPSEQDALSWMHAEEIAVADAPVLLAAAGGRPEAAVSLARRGVDARLWGSLPKAVQKGEPSVMQDWVASEILDALQKICHDLQLVQHGATPRFFAPKDLPSVHPGALSQWGKDLARAMRTVEHPFNPGLMQEALLSDAKNALNSGY